MIDYETYARIKHLHDQKGLAPTQIARELELDQRTVIRWLGEKHFRPRNPTIKSSKLDVFKDSIVRMLESYPYTAKQIFQRLQVDDFDGSYSVVKRFVRRVRPSRQKAYLTLAFAPGECAQVDWGSYGSIRVGDTQRRLSFFCYGPVLQPTDVCRVHRLPDHGAFPRLPPEGL